MPSHESPVKVTYPDGAVIRFEHGPQGWHGYGARGQCVIAHDNLTEAMEILGARHGIRASRGGVWAMTEPEEVRELDPPLGWREDEDGERWLEAEDWP